MTDSQQQARNLFDRQSDSEQVVAPRKRQLKKEKPAPKKGRKLKFESEDQEEREADIKGFLDLEAEEDSQEEELTDSSAELINEDKQIYEELYKVNHKRPTQQFIEKFDNKSPNQINHFYQKKVKREKNNDQIKQKAGDHQLFSVICRKGSEAQLVFNILNKARYCSQNPKQPYKCNITSVFCEKKRYPGLLFVQAANQADVKESLETFTDINTKKIRKEDKILSNAIFDSKSSKKKEFTEKQIVRVNKGLYRNDIGQIVKVYNNRVKLLIVPRVDLKLMNALMLQAENNYQGQALIDKKNAIFKKLTDPKQAYPKERRPYQRCLPIEAFQEYQDLNSIKKLVLTESGLLVLYFALSDIQRPTGTILPIELAPFGIKELKDQPAKLLMGIKLNPGEEVQIIAGELIGAYGKVKEFGYGRVKIECQNQHLKNVIVDEIPDHVEKKFADGTKVSVLQGSHKGSEGIVLSSTKTTVCILTTNNNEIQVLRRNVEKNTKGTTLCEENPFHFANGDVIKTTKDQVGIVIDSCKDYIKIINLGNEISHVSNLECGRKINTRGGTAQNKYNQTIRRGTLVKIMEGERKNVKGQVLCIYQGYAFLKSREVPKNQGMCVEKVDRLIVLTEPTYVSRPKQPAKVAPLNMDKQYQQSNASYARMIDR